MHLSIFQVSYNVCAFILTSEDVKIFIYPLWYAMFMLNLKISTAKGLEKVYQNVDVASTVSQDFSSILVLFQIFSDKQVLHL